LINHGYSQNNLGANLSYSYIAEKLATEGFYVVSIQNELPTDALLPMDGDIKKGRYPFWEQGVENNLFVIKELKKNNPNLNVEDFLIIGHSNGGDIAALFGNKYPDLVKKIITLDNRRMKLPTNQVKVLSLRSVDFAADEGVLPTKEDEKKFNMKIKFTKVKHNEMSDSGSVTDKQDIINQIMRFLK
jgi:dienelactone hydrolase